MEDRSKIINGILGTCLESIDFIHIYNYENGDQTIHMTMKDEAVTNEEIDITPVMLTKKMNLPEKEETKEEKPKTYLEDLLEKYPNTPLNDIGTPLYICPHHIGLELNDNYRCTKQDNCLECWSELIEKEKTDGKRK